MKQPPWIMAASCAPILLAAVLIGCHPCTALVVQEAAPASKGEPVPPAGTWPMFGGTPVRNMVNLVDTKIPVTWKVDEGKQERVKWSVELGSAVYGGPIIADGKVFVGTNNAKPRDPKVKGKDKAILMAFNEADGKFLWQIVHEFPAAELFNMARNEGLCSTPVFEGKHLYYVTPGAEVVCADTAGKIKWSYDMMDKLKVVPHHLSNCSPLVVGDLVMVITGNGVDEEGNLPSPKAPSFVALNKKTGTLAWQSNLPGAKIIEGQWSNPTLATVNGKPQVIFAGGDSVLYSFEPVSGELIWKCNCNPLPRKKREDREFDNYVIATPVVVGDRLFVGMGPYPEHPTGVKHSYVLCLDITRKGDVSLKNYDAKSAANKDSALVWAFGGAIEPRPEKGRSILMGSTISTAAVHDGLVYIAEERGYFHCLDAKTGQRHWYHEFTSNIWGSAYYVDGKVYVGVEDGDVAVFEHGKTKKLLATNSMEDHLHSTPVVAGGVLYITTFAKLYALR
jgi:outer membrane protein assembly factor BamB